MTSIKATYSAPGYNKVIEIPLESPAIEHLTDPILSLKNQVNEFLTQILEKEKTTSSTSIPEEEEQDPFEEETEDAEERPELLENQNVKKQKMVKK
ncbi:unnamed protein product [Rhizopus stolonifer]